MRAVQGGHSKLRYHKTWYSAIFGVWTLINYDPHTDGFLCGPSKTFEVMCVKSGDACEVQVRHSQRAISTVLLDPRDPLLQSERTQGPTAGPVYGRAKCLPMLGEIKT